MKELYPKYSYPNAVLLFNDNIFFYGYGIGSTGITCGEICFNTSITGYQEILSDPSYQGQIINFTFPHIGNVGTNKFDMEANKIYASGLIIRNQITKSSNHRSTQNFNDWLKANNLIGIEGVDTRAITKYIRKKGAQEVLIQHLDKSEKFDLQKLGQILKQTPSQEGLELAQEAGTKKNYIFPSKLKPIYKIVAIDYGAKINIFRSLDKLSCEIIVVPATTSFKEIIQLKPDGIFLSNGPGDPAATYLYTGTVIKEILKANIPLFGICLGHQLLALAIGAKTKKMEQGHRGANHPVKNLKNGQIAITSQNHGFEVIKDSLPKNAKVTHVSLFDNSVEGIELTDKLAFSVQYHPESSPGPHDSYYLFEHFIELIKQHNKSGV